MSNTPEVLTEDVADTALTLSLGAVRRLAQGDRFVRDGRWKRAQFGITRNLQGRRVGIVGLGRIGRTIARRCASFDCEIGYFGPNRKNDVDYRYFDDVVALADWSRALVAACPGGGATSRIVSRDALRAPDTVTLQPHQGSATHPTRTRDGSAGAGQRRGLRCRARGGGAGLIQRFSVVVRDRCEASRSAARYRARPRRHRCKADRTVPGGGD